MDPEILKGTPPEWALKEAHLRAGFTYPVSDLCPLSAHTTSSIHAHARTIAKHEQPPVDPDLIEAREIAAKVWDEHGSPTIAKEARSGGMDSGAATQSALAAIKRCRALERGEG